MKSMSSFPDVILSAIDRKSLRAPVARKKQKKNHHTPAHTMASSSRAIHAEQLASISTAMHAHEFPVEAILDCDETCGAFEAFLNRISEQGANEDSSFCAWLLVRGPQRS